MPSLIVALLWLAAQGSPSSGTIRITVLDAATRQPVEGVTVVLAEVSRSGGTDAAGRYVFTNVAPGPQHVAARRLGYAPRTLHALVPSTGVLDLTITLSALPARLTSVRVETRRSVAMRDIDAGDDPHVGDRSLSLAAIRNHPLLPEPDAILALAGGHATARPESPDGLHVTGGASDHIAYLIDGVPVLSPYHMGATFGAINADALDNVQLQVSPQTAAADALSGIFAASTRPVTDHMQMAGGLSATQARLTVELPLVQRAESGEAPTTGLLLSGRLLFPGLLGQKHESNQIDGDGSDGLVRLAAPFAGGALRIVAVDTRSDVAVADRVVDVDTGPAPVRNELKWGSSSIGARWERESETSRVQFALWRASSSADVAWPGDSAPLVLATSLRDVGALGLVRHRTGRGTWTLGIRAHRRSSEYTAVAGNEPGGLAIRGNPLLTVLRTEWTQPAFAHGELSAGMSTALYRGRIYLGPFAEWIWRPAPRITMAASLIRRMQFTQSLRNTESVVANVFPADLSVTAGGPVPVARSDQAMGVVAWRVAPSGVLTGRLWTRRLSGLALPAIGTGAPFADSVVPVGSGRAEGLSLDASMSGARWGFVAAYAAQRVRTVASDTTWQPEFGTAHTVDAGVVFFPGPSASIRLGVSGAAGRRSSGFGGAFEWEACNLIDRGCEFAGGPLRRDEAPGAIALPAYARVDLGARKHWHVTSGGRDVQVAVYVTWSNLFDRRNVLTYTKDGVTSVRHVVPMRPGSPLVIGFDWRF